MLIREVFAAVQGLLSSLIYQYSFSPKNGQILSNITFYFVITVECCYILDMIFRIQISLLYHFNHEAKDISFKTPPRELLINSSLLPHRVVLCLSHQKRNKSPIVPGTIDKQHRHMGIHSIDALTDPDYIRG